MENLIEKVRKEEQEKNSKEYIERLQEEHSDELYNELLGLEFYADSVSPRKEVGAGGK